MLVLDSLTRPVTDGESPMAPASSGVPVLRTGQWLGQGEAGARRKLANDELMKLHFLPLTFPAAPVVRGLVPWLLAPRLRSEEPGKDVTRARPGHDLGHLREIRLAALASPAMLAAQVHALLSAPGYRFTVSGQQQLTMQVNLTGIRYLSAESRIKDRFYSQDELSSVTSTSRAVGGAFRSRRSSAATPRRSSRGHSAWARTESGSASSGGTALRFTSTTWRRRAASTTSAWTFSSTWTRAPMAG